MEADADSAEGQALPWLSPTSAARLLACPASLNPVPGVSSAGRHQAGKPNAGTLAHTAVADWIRGGAWRRPSAAEALAHAFRTAAQEAGAQTAEIPDGRLTESRLRVRAPTLADLLRAWGANAAFDCELALADAGSQLRGVLDLLITSTRGRAVIDLKTGRDSAGPDLPQATVNQLLIYSHLVRQARGDAPTELAVLSLHTGLRTVNQAPGAAQELVARISTARSRWAAGAREAGPDPAACRFCRRRLVCDPHWEAARTWEDRDGVEGTVLRAAASENGRTALLLDTSAGRGWLTRIPTIAFATAALAAVGAPGTRVRAIHVRTTPDKDGHGIGWAASDWTALREQPPGADTTAPAATGGAGEGAV